MKTRILVSILVVFGAAPGERADAFELRGIQKNNQAVKRFQQEKFTEAYNGFAQGMGDLPFQPEVHYNLGRTFFENKEYEKALQESLTAAKLAEKSPETRFKALFQAASAQAALKRVDDAIATYQQALEINPESIETKTNIELLVASGQGGGESGDQQQDQGNQKNKDNQGQGDQDKDPKPPQKFENPRSTPRPFKSEDLSKKDVENILDELRQQEEQIRAKFQREGGRDAPKDRDW